MGETCGTHERNYEVHRAVIGKRAETPVLGRSRRRWVDNIKIRVLGFSYLLTYSMEQSPS